MPNFQQTASFQAPTDYNVEAAEIARRKALAQALQQQGMTPTEEPQTGMFHHVTSPMSGLGSLAQVLSGKYQENKAVEDEKKLAQKSNTERQQTFDRIAALSSGSPDLATDPAKVQLASLNTGTIADSVPDLQAAAPKATTPQQRNLLIAQLLSRSNLPDQREMGGKLLIEALTKENSPVNSMLGKISPKDYTADSFSKFMTSGNPSDLRAREEVVSDRLGDKIQYRGKYSTNPLGTAAMGVSPDTNARLAWDQYQFGNLSENQRQNLGIDRARLANQGIEAQYNTGQGVGSPIFTGMPQNAPMQFTKTGGGTPAPAAPPAPAAHVPRPAQPRPMGFAQGATDAGGNPINLPPKVANEVAAASLKNQNEMNNKRTFNMQGLNSSLDEAERILTGQSTGKKPTESGVGSIVDSVGGFFGVSPNGAAEADKLRSIGGALVAKMPRMEGPQSDKDVQLYREMAGQIGDSSLPIARRLAALQTVRDIYAKYEGAQQGGASGGWGGQERRSSGARNANRVVVDY